MRRLTLDLRAWQGLFDAGFDPHVAVTLDLWPLSNASLIRWVEHRVAT